MNHPLSEKARNESKGCVHTINPASRVQRRTPSCLELMCGCERLRKWTKEYQKQKKWERNVSNIDTTHDSGMSERLGYICTDDLKWKSNGKTFESHRKEWSYLVKKNPWRDSVVHLQRNRKGKTSRNRRVIRDGNVCAFWGGGRGLVRAANAPSHDLNGNYTELHTRWAPRLWD